MKKISFIIPAYNEEKNIMPVFEKLREELDNLKEQYQFEILFVNDGSKDGTLEEIQKLATSHDYVKYISFTRNFGKEIATTAAINHSTGDACIMLDADLQHPVELIPEFLEKWQQGFDVVVGVRKQCKSDAWVKRAGSKLFYKILNSITDVEVIPYATDFRLLDRVVMNEFNSFTERNRMTRALIDWLGFKRTCVYFDANERLHGNASYSFWKLFKLAMSSFISLSLLPLKLAGYIGVTITLLSGVSGFYILLGKYFYHWQFASTFSDAENLAIFIVFLVGIILMSIGLIALYVAQIHGEVIRRPLYVIRDKKL